MAVGMTSTRESGSSVQSTGTSWMRIPARCARTSNSVSKNQASSLLAKTLGSNPRQLESERAGDVPGAVGAGVVDDRDPRRKREARVEVGAEPADVGLEGAFFVVDRNGDIDDRHVLIVRQDSCRFCDRPVTT